MAEPGEPGNDGDTGTHQPEDDPESSLRAAFARAPDEGISVPELVTITGMSRRWVYYRLRELAAAGQVTQTARGRWRIGPEAGNRE